MAFRALAIYFVSNTARAPGLLGEVNLQNEGP